MPVLLGSLRSPFAPADHALAGWHPVDLAARVGQELLAATGIDSGQIDEIIVGCDEPVGAQGATVARAVGLAAGWPDRLSGMVIERTGSSGSAALHAAAAMIDSGQADHVLVVGLSSASMVQPGASALGRIYGRPWGDGPADRLEARGGLLPPVRAAELAAESAGIDRAAQDEWARRSYARRPAHLASIVTTPARPGDSVALQRDTPVSADVVAPWPEDGPDLPAVFDEDGTTTAASFAAAADGVTALLLAQMGSDPLARVVGTGRAAGDPNDATGGAGAAVDTLLGAHQLSADTITRWEVSEPCAAAALLVASALIDRGVDPERINPAGGALPVGDAGAAEDLRLSTDALISAAPGDTVMVVAAAPTGVAVSLWARL